MRGEQETDEAGVPFSSADEEQASLCPGLVETIELYIIQVLDVSSGRS